MGLCKQRIRDGSGTPLITTTGKVLAYVLFGQRKDAVFLKLQQLLEPFGITKFLHGRMGRLQAAHECQEAPRGAENTQKIESKHINLRTRIKRLVRRTICFSRRNACTIWWLGCSSIGMSLDEPSET